MRGWQDGAASWLKAQWVQSNFVAAYHDEGQITQASARLRERQYVVTVKRATPAEIYRNQSTTMPEPRNHSIQQYSCERAD